MAADTVVWAGLDYSMMRMVGTSNDIKVPDLIFQDMPQKWNDLFLDERLEGVANNMGKRVLIDIGAVSDRNRQLSTNQIVFTPDRKNSVSDVRVTEQDITRALRSYKMEHTDGLGLVFIIDSMVVQQFVPGSTHGGSTTAPSTANLEAVYVVFFDVATREIISARREVSGVSVGSGYRNYWFGPIKNIDSELGKYR